MGFDDGYIGESYLDGFDFNGKSFNNVFGLEWSGVVFRRSTPTQHTQEKRTNNVYSLTFY